MVQLKPAEAMKVGSLFSGIGGIDLGFIQAGFSVLWAVECDHGCCETYRKNFKGVHLIENDIRRVDPSALPMIDVLSAGFPCQSFSIGGKQKGFKDFRGNLFFEVMRFVEAHKPKYIFLENVANLVEHDRGHTFQVIYKSLVEQGYYVRYRIMRASEYGNIPQIRDRIYLLAFKNIEDCDRFCFPEPIQLTVSIEDEIDRGKQKKPLYYYEDDSPFAVRARSIVTDAQSIYRVYHDSIKPIKNHLCPTLTASMGSQKNQVPLVLDNYGVRKLTPFECLRFQGFPSDFRFPSSTMLGDAYKQIGNSVCIPVVYRLACSIKKIENAET